MMKRKNEIKAAPEMAERLKSNWGGRVIAACSAAASLGWTVHALPRSGMLVTQGTSLVEYLVPYEPEFGVPWEQATPGHIYDAERPLQDLEEALQMEQQSVQELARKQALIEQAKSKLTPEEIEAIGLKS